MFLVGVEKGKGLSKLLSLHPHFVLIPVRQSRGLKSRRSDGNKHSVIAQGHSRASLHSTRPSGKRAIRPAFFCVARWWFYLIFSEFSQGGVPVPSCQKTRTLRHEPRAYRYLYQHCQAKIGTNQRRHLHLWLAPRASSHHLTHDSHEEPRGASLGPMYM
jgi:hypothetical protein